jgi:tRNA-specific adenosine deaminase 1
MAASTSVVEATTLLGLPVDELVRDTHAIFEATKFKLPLGRWTILASFTLVAGSSSKMISLATGSRCLPAERLEATGDVVFDGHAEVLARRGAIRWFMEEAGRCSIGATSEWLQRGSSGKYELKPGVCVYLYISTIPCMYIHPQLPREWSADTRPRRR